MEGRREDEWEELLGAGVRRKVIVDGEGDSPELGHLVLFNWEGRHLLPSGETAVVFAKRDEVKTRIGDGDEIPGLELALRNMRAGQQCLVRCDTRFAYGPGGCPATETGDIALPPNADVELLVELIKVLSTTVLVNMTPREKIAEYERKKMVGKEHFARKDFTKALRAYASVVHAISEAEFSPGSAVFEEAHRLQIDCGNNAAIVYMRLGNLEKAKEAAVGVLVLDPLNAKALFRAGRVSSLQGNFAEAKLALQKALGVCPESKEIQAELGRLSARVKAYRSKTQAVQETMARSLFNSIEDKTVSPAGTAAGVARETVGNAYRDINNHVFAPTNTREATNARMFTFERFRTMIIITSILLVPLAAWRITYIYTLAAEGHAG